MARKSKGRLSKQEHTALNRKNAMVSLYFNRYLMIRYFLAIFFFSNFFWAYLAWGHWSAAVPIILLLLSILPCFQVGFIWGKTADIKLEATKWFYRIQWGVCIAMMILAWTAPMNQIWPMFRDITMSRVILFSIFAIGFILSSLVLRRFRQIDRNLDKQYGRIQFYEQKYGVKPGRK